MSPTTPTITIRDATFRRGDRVALRVDHLDIRPGVTALLGPNGSGKSTLLHAIARLIDPRPGTLTIDDPAADPQRREIAYVLQHQSTSAQLPITVAEAVTLGRAAQRGPFRRYNAADRAAALDAMERLDIAELATRQLSELSGGQRQRALIAQGLAQAADIILLDEPMAAVDPASATLIRTAIEDERAAGRTLVVATHNLDEARRYDRAVLLAGSVVATGTPDEVLTADHLSAAYAGRVLTVGSGTVVIDTELDDR